jgi:hypothetical protein
VSSSTTGGIVNASKRPGTWAPLIAVCSARTSVRWIAAAR